MNRYQITIKADAGADRANGKPDPIAASRGRVFIVYNNTAEEAAERFCTQRIPMFGMIPEAIAFREDIETVDVTNDDDKPVITENWTNARPG